MAQKFMTFKQVSPQYPVYAYCYIACGAVLTEKGDTSVVQTISQSVDGYQ